MTDHATGVMIRSMFLSFGQQLYSDQRIAGSLFHACCEEARDLTLLEAMRRLLTLVIAQIRSIGEFVEDVVSKMLDAICIRIRRPQVAAAGVAAERCRWMRSGFFSAG